MAPFRSSSFFVPSFFLTYEYCRYDHFTDRYDASEKQRTPSWCDRILWRTDKEKDVKCLFYRQFDADMSDHKVRMASSSKFSRVSSLAEIADA